MCETARQWTRPKKLLRDAIIAPMRMDGKPEVVEISKELFEKTKEKAEALYRTFGSVNCPYLKAKVRFDTNGLAHIKFKSWGRPRSRFEQYIRLKLVHLAPEVLQQSHTVQGIWNTTHWERQKKYGRWEKIPKPVTYYEFVAVVGKVRVKVIVKMITGGEPHLWSIIPFWRMNEVTKQRKLYEGNLETD